MSGVTSNGVLDGGFGAAGQATFDFGGTNDTGRSVAVDDSGSIFIAGTVSYDDNGSDFGLMKLDGAGVPVPGFGTAGQVRTDFRQGPDHAATSGNGLLVLANGRILLVGRSQLGGQEDFAIARYEANGTPDMTLDSDGKLVSDISAGVDDFASALVGHEDGRFVVAGTATENGHSVFAVVRYNADGTLDPEFGNGGIVTNGHTRRTVGNPQSRVASRWKIHRRRLRNIKRSSGHRAGPPTALMVPWMNRLVQAVESLESCLGTTM